MICYKFLSSKNITPGEITAAERTMASTATNQNSDVGKPGLIEKAKFSSQRGGTKHENEVFQLTKSGKTREMQDLDNIRQMMNEALQGGHSSIELLTEKVQELIEGKQKDTEMIEQLQIKTEELSRLLKEERERNASQRATEIQTELAAKNTEIAELQEVTAQLREETERLRTSLSELAGAKLTEGNSDITDLSDPNRPQKLCEKFNSLYDNSWTDAYEFIYHTENSEKAACSRLIDIFKNCWKFCCDCSDRQMEALQDKIAHPEVHTEDLNRPKLTLTLTTLELKMVKDTRKALAEHALSNISQFYWKNKIKNLSESLKPFVDACLEICWYSAINDPKLDFSFDPKKNPEDFRAYTQSGKYIDYVLWPAMYLHEGGSLLYKGVVQLKKEEREQM